MKTASSWDSYKDTLKAVLTAMPVKSILEYGPGESTKIMLSYSKVTSVVSFEHSKKYYEKWKNEIKDNRFELHHEEDSLRYIDGTTAKFDLIFIDGVHRESCILHALSKLNRGGVVMVHDAERKDYHSHILTYDYVFFTDNGSTATMTDDFNSYKRFIKGLVSL